MKSTILSTPHRFGLYRAIATLGALAVLFFFADMADAFAQTTSKNFNDVQKSIGRDVVQIPRLLAVTSYALGAFFAGSGLLRLRAWIGDSDRNTLNTALFRIAVSGLLIALPHIFIVANNTLFGEGAGGAGMIAVPAPKLGAFSK